MANVDRPNGFRFAKTLTGSPVAGMIRQYNVDASNAAAIGIGSVVKLDADGNASICATNEVPVGVVVGTGEDNIDHGETGYFKADSLEQRHLPATTAGVIGVIPAEGNLFEVQSDSDLDLAQGDTADFTAESVNTTTGNSTMEITTSSNADVRVIEMVKTPDNDTTLANARYIVQLIGTENPIS